MARLPRPLVALGLTTLALTACKGGRANLEQLVPDGATGMASIDAKAILGTEMYAKAKTAMEGTGDAKAKETLDQLKNECKLDLEQMEAVVIGFDALSQNAMGAFRLPNLGTADALRCLDDLTKKSGAKNLWTVGETDGKPSVSIEDGKALGWALDDDTLVLSTQGWASAVQARMKGESKGAIDNNLEDAVALVDRSRHVWVAGEIPALVTPFLDETPLKGVKRAGVTIHYGDDLELAAAVAFGDEAAAKSLHDLAKSKIEEFKGMAVSQGVPQKTVDSLELEVDGAVLKGKVDVPMDELMDKTTESFTRYMDRSKTSEAKVMVAKMYDGASMYFNEEHVDRGSVDLTAMVAAHKCPNDGRTSGEAGVTPPLSVKCGSKCTPGQDGYDPKLWTDNEVWKGLGFQMEGPHYFHYNFLWTNDPKGYGSCQFTAQAFGDLDGDGIYSTFERSGAADQLGVNAAAGLYIDNEVE